MYVLFILHTSEAMVRLWNNVLLHVRNNLLFHVRSFKQPTSVNGAYSCIG